MSVEFDREFSTTEEALRELDNIVDVFADLSKYETTDKFVESPEKISQVAYVYSLMKLFTKNSDGASVDYALHDPYYGVGRVTVEAPMLVFGDTKLLARASEFADGVKIDPMPGGTCRIVFNFTGLLRPEEGGEEDA